MKIYSNIILFIISLAALTLSSCNKESYPPTITKMRIGLDLKIGASSIEWGSVKYFNAAGNQYGVNKINLYISNVKLKQSTGKIYSSKKVFYIDPSIFSKSYFMLDSIPPGVYSEMTFVVGVDSISNKTLKLPATNDNINMAWPDMIGGGYHFLKFEGHYIDTIAQEKGFAIHLGKNENLPYVKITASINQKYWDHNYSLNFDLNKIFEVPYTYNFNIDPNYTMMDSIAMGIIKNNITDAFSLIQNK